MKLAFIKTIGWLWIFLLVFFIIGFNGCGQGNSSDPPQILAITPDDGSTNIFLNTNIIAIFNKAINTSTIDETNFRLLKLNGSDKIAVDGTITYHSSTFTAIFDPVLELEPETTYEVLITRGVKGSNGEPIIQEYTWTFSTGGLTDKESPTFGGAKDIESAETGATYAILKWAAASDNITDAEKMIYLIFMADFNGAQNYQVPDYRTAPGVTSYRVTGLRPERTYYFVVLAQDEAGNISDVIREVSLATPAEADITTPAIKDFKPGEGAVNVSTNTNITITFNEDIKEETLNSETVKLIDSSDNPVDGRVSYNESTRTLTFDPNVILNTESTYVVTLKTGITDVTGNALEREFHFSFVTGAALPPDDLPPVFAGVSDVAAKAGTSDAVVISWNAATDNITSQVEIVYLIYMATSSGTENYNVSNYSTSSGVTSYTVAGLDPGTQYFFVVRAKDMSGNISNNSNELSVTTNP